MPAMHACGRGLVQRASRYIQQLLQGLHGSAW
jgi:hypothetical protein